MSSATWVIIDTSFLVWREFYGGAHQDPAAAVSGAVYFAKSLQDRFLAHETTVWAFDAGPYNRATLLPTYKAGREAKERTPEEQEARVNLRFRIDALADKLRAKRCNVLRLEGFEADDHIARAVEAVPKGDHAVICSRDRDLFQLLSHKCTMLDPVTDTIHTRDTFRAAYGNLHPQEWPEVKALSGCTTDDVPGILGVGDKTAVKYLTGKMNKLSPLYGKISNFIGTMPHVVNLGLCRLPFPGTPSVRLERKEGAFLQTCGGTYV